MQFKVLVGNLFNSYKICSVLVYDLSIQVITKKAIHISKGKGIMCLRRKNDLHYHINSMPTQPKRS